MWPPDLIIILKATKKTNGKYFKLQPLKILFGPGAPWQLSQRRVTLQNCSEGLWESLWWFLGARTKSMARLPGYKLFERPLALAYLILIQIYWNETLTPKYSPPISSGKIWSKVETAQGEDQGTRSLMLATQCSSCTEESSVTPRRLTLPQTTTFTSWGWDPVSTPFQHNLSIYPCWVSDVSKYLHWRKLGNTISSSIFKVGYQFLTWPKIYLYIRLTCTIFGEKSPI